MTEEQYEQLKALAVSPGWKQVEGYVKKQISALQNELEGKMFTDLSEVKFIQGKLQALRSVLDYPGTRVRAFERKKQGG